MENEITEEYINITNKLLLKNTRNLLLNETDKYLMPDYPLAEEQLLIVKEYRQQLRNLTSNDYIMPE